MAAPRSSWELARGSSFVQGVVVVKWRRHICSDTVSDDDVSSPPFLIPPLQHISFTDILSLFLIFVCVVFRVGLLMFPFPFLFTCIYRLVKFFSLSADEISIISQREPPDTLTLYYISTYSRDMRHLSLTLSLSHIDQNRTTTTFSFLFSLCLSPIRGIE